MSWDSFLFTYAILAGWGIFPAVIFSVISFFLALFAYKNPKEAVQSFWVGAVICGLVAVLSMLGSNASFLQIAISFVATLIPPIFVFHLVAAPLLFDRSGRKEIEKKDGSDGGTKPLPDIY